MSYLECARAVIIGAFNRLCVLRFVEANAPLARRAGGIIVPDDVVLTRGSHRG